MTQFFRNFCLFQSTLNSRPEANFSDKSLLREKCVSEIHEELGFEISCHKTECFIFQNTHFEATRPLLFSVFLLEYLFSSVARRFMSIRLTRVTSPPNSTPRRFPSYLLLTLLLNFLFIFYFPLCTLPDFPSISPQASLPFLSCCHRTTTYFLLILKTLSFLSHLVC